MWLIQSPAFTSNDATKLILQNYAHLLLYFARRVQLRCRDSCDAAWEQYSGSGH